MTWSVSCGETGLSIVVVRPSSMSILQVRVVGGASCRVVSYCVVPITKDDIVVVGAEHQCAEEAVHPITTTTTTTSHSDDDASSPSNPTSTSSSTTTGASTFGG